MSNIDELKRHKQKKKYERIISDIPQIIRVLALTQRTLSVFKMYAAVHEIISILETNKTLLEAQLRYNQAELKKIMGES
jgi:hypothetical protein